MKQIDFEVQEGNRLMGLEEHLDGVEKALASIRYRLSSTHDSVGRKI